MEAKTTAGLLEREPCGRCGGGGRYSYCQTHGDICFKCGGKGTTLTKRGFEANKYLIALRSKPASAVQTGDVIREQVVAMNGATGWRWAKVLSVKDTGETEFGRLNPQYVGNFVTIETETCVRTTLKTDMIRIKQTEDQAAKTLEMALAYQASLTKSGTVRKHK